MWHPFRKKKQKRELTEAEVENLNLHVAGSIVRHKNFDHLTYFKNSDKLSKDFIEKWVNPFYMTDLASDEYLKNFQLISNELTEDIVEKLLGDFNWRMRIVGATFSAIRNYQRFEEQIGVLLLKSEVTYAADGYVLALATFNTNESVKYFSQYLDHYLRKKDLWFDQNDVMAALKWLDQKNETNEHAKFLEPWNKFIANNQNWDLNRTYLNFEKDMVAIKQLSELNKN